VSAAARILRLDPGNDEALDELDHALQEMEAIVVLYEEAFSERGIRLPY